MKNMDKTADSFNIWQCESCEGQPEFEQADFEKHLKEVHGIDPKDMRGSRSMVLHIDGRDWYQTNYEWVIKGLAFLQSCRNKRNKHTMIY